MKYNILSLIKDKLERTITGRGVMNSAWEYDYIHNRIVHKSAALTRFIIFETYGEYPLAICQEIIDDHNGNLLIGMSFDEYFNVIAADDSHNRRSSC